MAEELKPLDVSVTDIAIIERELCNLRGPLECLEWGAGGSTYQFARFLQGRGVSFHWTTIEHDAGWANRVRAATVGLPVDVLLFPSSKPKEEPMDEYVTHPLRMRRRFDFIFVDGRHRRRCLLTASKLTAPGGVVILHDAERTYYHSAFSAYTHSQRCGDKLWIGRIDTI